MVKNLYSTGKKEYYILFMFYLKITKINSCIFSLVLFMILAQFPIELTIQENTIKVLCKFMKIPKKTRVATASKDIKFKLYALFCDHSLQYGV